MRRPPRAEQRARQDEEATSSSESPAVDALARNVGHAINNPLGALMISLDLALEVLGEETQPLAGRLGEIVVLLKEAREAAQSIRAIVVDLKATATPSNTKDLAPRSGPPAPESSPPESMVSSRGLPPARVLVVDDDPLVSRALARSLNDCEVVVASDARDALARIGRGEAFDVIVCDLMMPGMTGMDLYDAIRQVAPAQLERMIFLSGGAVTTRAREFVATVPNILMEKPFDIRRLREIVRSRRG